MSDKIQLKIQDELDPINVHRVLITLSMCNTPVIRIQFKPSSKSKGNLSIDDKIGQAIMNSSTCYISYNGTKLEFIISGIRYDGTMCDNDIGTDPEKREIQGILLDNPIRQWIGVNSLEPVLDENLPLIQVYQRTEEEPWEAYLNRLLDDMIHKGTGVDTLCKNISSNYGCLWRRRDWTNLYFLNQVIAYYRYLTGNIEGWALFNADEKPISLISRFNKQIDLKDHWRIFPRSKTGFQNFGFIAHRLFKDFDDNKRLKILDNLARRKSIGVSEEMVIPKIPGPIKFGGNASNSFFARSITYHFTPNIEDERGIHVVVDITKWDDKHKFNPFPATYLKAIFNKWVDEEKAKKAKGKLISLMPSNQKDWIFSKGGKPSQDSLYAKVITPTYVRGGEQGLYCTFREGDELICVLQAGQVAICPGAQQVYNPHFDDDCIAINSERLVFSASPPNINEKLDEDIIHMRLSRSGKIDINSNLISAKGIGDQKTEINLDGTESIVRIDSDKAVSLHGNNSKIDLRAGMGRIESKEDTAFVQVDGNGKTVLVNAEKMVKIVSDKSEINQKTDNVFLKTGSVQMIAKTKFEIESDKVNIKSKDVNVGE